MAFDAWLLYGVNSPAQMAGSNAGNAYFTPNQNGQDQVDTTEGNRKMTVLAGTVDKLRVFIVSVTSTPTAIWRGRLNGASGNLVVTEPSGGTGELEDTTHSDTTANLDTYGIQGTGGGVATTCNNIGGLGFHYAATVAETVPVGGCGRNSSNTSSGNFFEPLMGGFTGINLSSTESSQQHKVRAPGTFQDMRSTVSTAKSGATWTFSYRGGAAGGTTGNSTTSYASGATGTVDDTTHTDTLTSGDLVNGMNTSTAATVTTVVQHQGTFVASAHTWDAAGFIANTNGNSAGAFYVILGGDLPILTTEANAQHRMRFASGMQNMRLNCTGNPTTGFTYQTRKNAANGNNTVTLGSGATGYFEDTTHKDVIASGDLINTSIGTSSSNNSTSFHIVLMGLTANNANIATVFGGFSQVLNATVVDQAGITTNFGLFSQTINVDVEATFHGPIATVFGSFSQVINATDLGAAGGGIRQFWTF